MTTQPEVRRWGDSEFQVLGTLREWSIIDRLRDIKVPTLLINGAEDYTQDICVEPFQKGIGEELTTWVKFHYSSHMPFWEEPEKYLQTVRDFLLNNE